MNKFIIPLVWVVGIVVCGLSIGGIAQAQLLEARDLFIAILVLTLFIVAVTALLFLRSFCAKRKAGGVNNYDINGAEGGKGGKGQSVTSTKAGVSNAGFAGASGGGEAGKGDKWVANYVPYGDLPAGTTSVTSVTSVEVTSEVNGDTKWKKNYVEYKGEDEEKRDSNKE